MKLHAQYTLIVLLCQCLLNYSLHILGVLPISSVSHTKTAQIVLQGLAKKGHNVTVISYYGNKVNQSNYNEVLLGKPSGILKNAVDIGELNYYYSGIFGPLYKIPMRLLYLQSVVCELLSSDIFQRLLSSNDVFDIVFLEFFNTDCMSVLADKFQARIVGYTATCPMPWVANSIGLPLDSSYYPNVFLDFTNKMTFLQRAQNSFVNAWQVLFYRYVTGYQDSAYANRYYKNVNPSEITRHRTDLVISNCHFSLNWPRTQVQTIVDVAGIVPEKSTLPQVRVIRIVRAIEIFS